MKFDLSLYLVTDRELSRGRSVEFIVSEAVKGGVRMVQLREKDCSGREFLEQAYQLKKILEPKGIPLIINDRVDIALACGAEGVHVGQSDIPADKVRELMGPDAIIGLSVETPEQAAEANALNIDYIGLSPVFFTATKDEFVQELGFEGVRELTSISKFPAVGIGGLNASNAKQVIDAGADGIAVVSAISMAEDPMKAARELSEIINS